MIPNPPILKNPQGTSVNDVIEILSSSDEEEKKPVIPRRRRLSPTGVRVRPADPIPAPLPTGIPVAVPSLMDASERKPKIESSVPSLPVTPSSDRAGITAAADTKPVIVQPAPRAPLPPASVPSVREKEAVVKVERRVEPVAQQQREPLPVAPADNGGIEVKPKLEEAKPRLATLPAR
jgi:hypothetical protein